MPEMNGMAFVHEISNRCPRPGVIMLTAYAGVNSYHDVIASEMYAYLSKPVKLNVLKDLIKQTFLCRNDEHIKPEFNNAALL
jgi:DNA-binding NtrC family response regulator